MFFIFLLILDSFSTRDLLQLNDTQEITQALLKFRDERDWAQFHTAKDLALALNIEAGELLEAFLWKSSEQADIDKVKEELADVLAFAFLLAEKYDFDVKQIVLEKIEKNALKYPVEKSRGSAKKYTDL
ncbi:nucleotide pyrophosphohydrolase [Nitrosomonas ureae]|uniref:NTP pyrophosphatase, house-cleaning of non-canonical NTPs n=1 Tax=Nitrosomonas ureae TaxID=44577 RepID=A0A1H5SEL7_9PROT|nr:nucleotide pyrophosphohydrolase [Nitrosomonas ureae]SEF49123.1 NTP pyrophosphatase, house-cleaning of non-canonical NTPs [Nitrosomonas ureae]